MVIRTHLIALLTALFCLTAAPASANIKESLTASVIYPTNGVMYADEVAIVRVVFQTLRASRRGLSVSAVQENFEIVAQREVKRSGGSRKIDLETNQFYHIYETELHIQPKKVGSVEIPAMHQGRAKSSPTPLTVHPSSGAKGFDGRSRDIFLKATISNMSPKLGEEVEYRVQVYRKEFKNAGSFKRIIPDGAEHRRFDDPIETDRVQNNTRYKMRTRVYKFYPTRTGVIELPEQEYEIKEYIPASSNNLRKRMLRIPAQSIRVQPPVGNEDTWLPAKTIEITGKWENEPPVFRLGDPSVLQVAIKIEGQLAEFLPTIPVPESNENFSVYATKPKIHPPKPGSLRPILVDYQVTFIPKKAGDFTLPEVKLDWWNIRSQKAETSRIASKVVSVQAGANNSTSASQAAADAALANNGTSTTGIWPWLTFLFGALWLASIAVIIILYRRYRDQIEQLQNNPNSQMHEKPLPTTPSGLKRELRKACEQNDAKLCETLLLKIATARWKVNVLSLGNLKSQLVDGPLYQQIDQLMQYRYGSATGQFSGARLWAAFSDDSFEQIVSVTEQSVGRIEPL